MVLSRLLPLLAALVLLCCGCGHTHAPTSPTDESPASVSGSDPLPDESQVSAPADTKPVSEASAPVELPPESKPISDPTPPAPPAEPDKPPVDSQPHVPAFHIIIPDQPAYDFSQPVPESNPVENDYFADAAFLGDSRTEGFWLYSGVKQGRLLAGSGLSVFSLHEKRVASVGGTRYTAPEVLSMESFGKVYIGLGLNELGYRDLDAVYTAYCQAVDTVRRHQPQAVIYMQTLIPVNTAQAASAGSEGHVNNDRIQLYNDLIRRIAAEKQVPLLDLYSAFIVDGQLPEDASRDGVHLLPPYCQKQLEYMKCHTVTPEQLTAPAPSDGPADSPVETEVSGI